MNTYHARRRRIYERDGGICGMCGKPVDVRLFDLDHIIPRSRGGGDQETNLRVTHRRCNRQAGQRLRQPGAGGLPWSVPSRW